MKKYNVAIVGVTGNVGREILNILYQRKFPVKKIHALASEKSDGLKLTYGVDRELIVRSLENFDFKDIDIVLSSPGSEVSKKFVPTKLSGLKYPLSLIPSSFLNTLIKLAPE